MEVDSVPALSLDSQDSQTDGLGFAVLGLTSVT